MNTSDTTTVANSSAADADDVQASAGDANHGDAIDKVNRRRRPKPLAIALGAALILSTLVGVLATALHDPGDAPAGTSPESVARDYVASVNADDWPHVRALLAPSFVFHDDDNTFVQGRSGFLVWSEVIRDSYPDRTIEVAAVRVVDDVATVQFRASGGDARRCEPGARPHDVVKIRVRERLIVEMWSTYSEFGLGC